jgi:hypothetical protein
MMADCNLIAALLAPLAFFPLLSSGQTLNLTNAGTIFGVPNGGVSSGVFKVDVAKIPTRVSFDPAKGGPLTLTRDRAVALAREAAVKDGRTDITERRTWVNFVEGHVSGSQEDVPEGACLWYYIVEFNRGQKGGVRYAVLLNEFVIKED